MTIEGEILANAGQAEPTDSGDTGDVSDVQAEVDAALEKDPNRILAKKVQADLDEAGVGGDAAAPPAEPQQDEEFKAEKARIQQALSKRNQTFKEREAAKQEAETIKAEAYRMKQEAEQFQAKLQYQYKQMAEFARDLKHNPAEAIRKAGLDPEEFILGLAREGTPEGALQKQLREQNEKIQEFERWKREQGESYQRQQQQEQERQAAAFRQKVENDFHSMATSDKYANVKKAVETGLLSRQSLVLEGDSIADKYREATGQEASLDDILEYIDGQVSSAISKLSGASQVKAPQTPGRPAQASAARPQGRTLSADNASERRTLQRDLSDGSSEERREAAKSAVKAVLEKARKQE